MHQWIEAGDVGFRMIVAMSHEGSDVIDPEPETTYVTDAEGHAGNSIVV